MAGNTPKKHRSLGKILASERNERKTLTLWRNPFKTTSFFIRECLFQCMGLIHELMQYKLTAACLALAVLSWTYFRIFEGAYQSTFIYLEKKIIWWGWWILLGFMSSCGFGSGLHTFVLYLGPFIAQVTMSAFVCKSIDFPEPPYPEQIVCPGTVGTKEDVTFFRIVRKVQIESILWGFGTALGELPPYFMARGARLSGRMNAQELELNALSLSESSVSDLDAPCEGQQIENGQMSNISETLTIYQLLEVFLQRLVMRTGFFGIMLCASVPNPLFDLAGMTCGHFLVPFASFFGATFIGKALIKVHIQQFAVIAVSSENHMDAIVSYIGRIPVVGESLQKPFMDYLREQKEKLQNKFMEPKQSWIQIGIGLLVSLMMLMFVVSIVNAMAQAYHRRQCASNRSSGSKKKS